MTSETLPDSTNQISQTATATATARSEITNNTIVPLFDPIQLDIYHITKRLLIMRFPSNKRTQYGGIYRDYLYKYFNKEYKDHYLILNFSNIQYKDIFPSVMEFRYPGYPFPPLSQISTIFLCIRSWLREDSKNIVVCHDSEISYSRAISILACYLFWSSLQNNENEKIWSTIFYCVDYIQRSITAKDKYSIMLMPTQIRYLRYLNYIIENNLPLKNFCTIKNLIVGYFPSSLTKDNIIRLRVQLYQDGKYIYDSLDKVNKDINNLPTFSNSSRQLCNIVIDKNCIYGDILIRIYIVNDNNQKDIILQFGFHTGYLKISPMFLLKRDLDYTVINNEFSDDFHLEMHWFHEQDNYSNDKNLLNSLNTLLIKQTIVDASKQDTTVPTKLGITDKLDELIEPKESTEPIEPIEPTESTELKEEPIETTESKKQTEPLDYLEEMIKDLGIDIESPDQNIEDSDEEDNIDIQYIESIIEASKATEF